MRPCFLLLAMAAALTGCSRGDPADPAEGAGGWHIAPGIYGNVRHDKETGVFRGVEVQLAQGSEGKSVDIALCDDSCGPIERRPVRRGLNGVSFALEGDGGPIDVTITPGGSEGVELSADLGRGLTTQYLPRIDRKLGLAVARDKAK